MDIVKKIEDYERTVVLRDGTSVQIDDILQVDGEAFTGI